METTTLPERVSKDGKRGDTSENYKDIGGKFEDTGHVERPGISRWEPHAPYIYGIVIVQNYKANGALTSC